MVVWAFTMIPSSWGSCVDLVGENHHRFLLNVGREKTQSATRVNLDRPITREPA